MEPRGFRDWSSIREGKVRLGLPGAGEEDALHRGSKGLAEEPVAKGRGGASAEAGDRDSVPLEV